MWYIRRQTLRIKNLELKNSDREISLVIHEEMIR